MNKSYSTLLYPYNSVLFLLTKTCICYCVIYTVQYPLYAVIFLVLPNETGTKIIDTMSIFGHIFTYSLCGIYAMRVYLLYYDHEYQRLLCSQKWKAIINPMVQQNWYIKHRKKYGSETYLYKHIVIPAVIGYFIIFLIYHFVSKNISESSSSSTTTFTLQAIHWGMNIIAPIICLFVGLFYWRKVPSFQDRLRIRQEFAFTAKYFVSLLVLYGIILILSVTVNEDYASFSLLTTELFYLFFVYYLVIYPIKQNEEAEDPNNIVTGGVIHGQQVSMSMQTWIKCVEWIDKYERFAAFLQSEFSVENLLYITESAQIKQYIMMHKHQEFDQGLQGIRDKIDLGMTDIALSDQLPLSLIVTNLEKDGDIFNAFKSLYHKYICPTTAELEINISHRCRNILINYFNSTTSDHGAHCIRMTLPAFEQSLLEISGLLRSSFSRFQRSQLH